MSSERYADNYLKLCRARRIAKENARARGMTLFLLCSLGLVIGLALAMFKLL